MTGSGAGEGGDPARQGPALRAWWWTGFRARGEIVQLLAQAMIWPGCRSARCRGNDRYPDTAGYCNAARRPPGHSVGKLRRQNYVA